MDSPEQGPRAFPFPNFPIFLFKILLEKSDSRTQQCRRRKKGREDNILSILQILSPD
jgi:hypothetical protein